MAPFTTDNFDKNLVQSLEGEDVDDGLDGAVEEGEEEGPVQPLGRVRDGDGGAKEGEAVRPDADEEQPSDENHFHCHSLQDPAIRASLKNLPFFQTNNNIKETCC